MGLLVVKSLKICYTVKTAKIAGKVVKMKLKY